MRLRISGDTASAHGEYLNGEFIINAEPPEVTLESNTEWVTPNRGAITIDIQDRGTGIKSVLITTIDKLGTTEARQNINITQNGIYDVEVTGEDETKVTNQIEVTNIDTLKPEIKQMGIK